MFPWNESSLVWGFAVCLAEPTCYAISCTLMGLHKFKTKKKGFFHYDEKCLGCPEKITQSSSKSLKAVVVQAAGEWMFSSASTGWRQSLIHFIKHPSISVEFGCPWGWIKEYLGLPARVEVSSFPSLLFTRVWAFKNLSLLRQMKFGLYKKRKKKNYLWKKQNVSWERTRKSILEEQLIVCVNKYTFQ